MFEHDYELCDKMREFMRQVWEVEEELEQYTCEYFETIDDDLENEEADINQPWRLNVLKETKMLSAVYNPELVRDTHLLEQLVMILESHRGSVAEN